MDSITGTLSEWQKARIGKFTASEVWKLFVQPKTNEAKEKGWWSETALTYIMEKAVEQITGFKREISAPALEHGNVNEAEAFEAFNEICKLNFTPSASVFFPYMNLGGASPDGVQFCGLDIEGVSDIKCPYDPVSFFDQKLMMQNCDDQKFQGVPRNYYYQLQMQMLSTGASYGYLVRYLTSSITDQYGNKYEFALPRNQRLFYKLVKRESSAIEQLIERINSAEIRKQEFIKRMLQ